MNAKISTVRDSSGRVHAVEYRRGAPINTSNFAGDGDHLSGFPTMHLPDGRELQFVDGRLRACDGEWFDAA